MHDELGDHRVVEHRNLATLVNAGVDTHATALGDRHSGFHGLRRRQVAHQPARGGQEAAERVFGVDAALDGPALARNLVLGKGQRLASGHADHHLHEIDARDALGNRVFHLQPGVHLQEVEALVTADDELDRACALVLHSLRQRHRLRAHGLARGIGDEGRRRLFDDLLVAALDGAFALVQEDDIAVGVAQDLDLDVARLLYELLDEDAVVAEAGQGLVAAGAETLQRFLVVAGYTQALAAAAGAGLDHHRVADVACDLDRALGARYGFVPARDRADLRRLGELLRCDLVAHRGDAVMLGPDEDDALFLDTAREVLVLRKKSVARVHGLRACGLAGVDDLLRHEIAFAAGGRADTDRLVGQFNVARVAVSLGIHRDGGNAHAARGLDDAAGDFAAVGDQDLGEHGYLRVQGSFSALAQRRVQRVRVRVRPGYRPTRPAAARETTATAVGGHSPPPAPRAGHHHPPPTRAGP